MVQNKQTNSFKSKLNRHKNSVATLIRVRSIMYSCTIIILCVLEKFCEMFYIHDLSALETAIKNTFYVHNTKNTQWTLLGLS